MGRGGFAPPDTDVAEVPPMLTDRRKVAREEVPFSDSIAWFSLAGRLYPVHLVNRSPEGAGVTIRQRPPVDIGAEVVVEWLRPSPAAALMVVRNLAPLGDGHWYVGMEFNDSADARPEAADALVGAPVGATFDI